ncbi:MAG: isoprenoid biosynthesis glyoxalase ElbB [Raineya sp.]
MEKKMKFGVLLSGCGVYDGAEIHESVSVLLALDKMGIEAVCIAPNVEQHHVINHLTGEEMPEKRNVLIEAARIARGAIVEVNDVNIDELDALVMPGGFGVAKNFTKWAFQGPNGEILDSVKKLIRAFYQAKKPIGAVCMAPTTIAKALEGLANVQLTIGNVVEKSPYDIKAISEGINATGNVAVMVSVEEVFVDKNNKIVTSPCYMMEASISQVYAGAEKTIEKLKELLA